MIKRPVWLFSLDSEHFSAAPMTIGGLKACFLRYGKTASSTDIELVHFLDRAELDPWLDQFVASGLPRVQAALDAGIVPVFGFSFYTWNAAEFLSLINQVRAVCPQAIIVAGGPHVQQVEDYLLIDPIDAIAMGEGEFTFVELLDTPRANWSTIAGLAYVEDGKLRKNVARERLTDLSVLPSALEVIELKDAAGKPLYDSVSYETSRGCPYKCAFCEWGTGAIGGKMYQLPMERIKDDWEKIIAAGIANIWLADSNFGALKDDLAKTELICELKQRTGLPSTFATSWSKKHSPKVQEIVLKLHQHGLLPHYQLALQTLTPLALKLSNRKNMSANQYEPIAKQMAEAGVPIAAELIWGLPGDNLADFERNLDTLMATFPNINIFTYSLLPGTEFYEKREQYQLKAIPIAGYGKAKGEYVIGCHTFDEDEGLEGYFLVTAQMVLVHGAILPLTLRYLALEGSVPASPVLRFVLKALVARLAHLLELSGESQLTQADKIKIYESRSALYLGLFDDIAQTYQVIADSLTAWLTQNNAAPALIERTLQVLQLDQLLAPITGGAKRERFSLDFDALSVLTALEAMDLPRPDQFVGRSELDINTPGGVGSVLTEPDGGSWLKGQWQPVSQLLATAVA